MVDPEEPHAFISYVREDDAAVDGLESALEAAGIKVWRDKHALGPGDDWKRVIRSAIQGNTLAFIPCFSSQANANERSVMREEIALAIEEYRLRPPDRAWILSVRFDDCDVPDYDIFPGKTLRSLNWTSLFDAQYPSELVKLVERVKLLLGTSSGPAATTAAVGDASDRVRGPLIAAAVREGTADAVKAADADRLVRTEARNVVGVLRDENQLSQTVDPFNSAAMLERCQKLTKLTEPLLDAAVALGAYGQSAQGRVAAEVVSSLARVAVEPRAGLHDLLGLLRLPASLVMTAGALGAVATENPAMLRAFILKPEVATNYSANAPVHQLISPWEAYGNTRIADLYWKTLSGANPDPSDYDRSSRGGERYMAPQGVLKHLMRPLLSEFTIDDAGYDLLYSHMEVVVGMAVFDWSGPHVKDIQYPLSANWVGRHVVDEKYANPNTAQRILAQLEDEGQSWWPLRGNHLFGGDPYRAEDALADYIKAVDSQRSSMRM